MFGPQPYRPSYPRARPGLAQHNEKLTFVISPEKSPPLSMNIADKAVTTKAEMNADVLETVKSECGEVIVQRMNCNMGLPYSSSKEDKSGKNISFQYLDTAFLAGAKKFAASTTALHANFASISRTVSTSQLGRCFNSTVAVMQTASRFFTGNASKVITRR